MTESAVDNSQASSSIDAGAMVAGASNFASGALTFVQEIDWMTHIETLCGWISIAVPFAFPIFLVYVSYKIGLRLWAFIQTLQVVGDPNEWVVVIRDGKHVKSGIGLNFYKMPWDTVAKFPAGVKEV
jgi:hypothetical protein